VAVRVSTSGGEFPAWRGDGRELYYRVPDGSIRTVGVRLDGSVPGFVALERQDPLLFTLVTDWPARVK